MKLNKWTVGLATAGVVSMSSVAMAQNETVMTAVEGTSISGYVSTTAIWKPGTGNGALPGRSFTDGVGQDGFNLDVVSLTVSKSIDDSEWAAGYTFQGWYGPDAVGFNASPGSAGEFAVKNANVDLRIPVGNGLDLKMGVFDAIIGYESSDIPSNPNYGRSYGWFIEPTVHTGLLASYMVNDMISVSGGIANTYTAGVNARGTRATAFPGGPAPADESEKAYMAAVALTAPESMGFLEGATLYVGVLDGLQVAGAASALDTTSVYAGLSIPTPVEGLTFGLAYDYRFNGPAGPFTSTWANAIAAYVSYAVTENVTINYRADYARGTDGTYYVRDPFAGTAAATDDQATNKLMSNTVTVDFGLWENVLTRLEARWDTTLDGTKQFGGQAAFAGAQNGADGDNNAFTLALNVVYQF